MADTAPLPQLPTADRQRIHRAAYYATRLYPGPMGKLVDRELSAYAEFGYRLGHDATVVLLVEQLHGEWAAAEREGKVA
jgi:hypothetical protein